MSKSKNYQVIGGESRASFLQKMLLGLIAAAFPFSCKKNNDLNPKVSPGEDSSVKVFMVKNGSVKQNISKLFELLGGITRYISPTDVVVLKCNGQWPNQGYTNTECIKYVIEEILAIPNFSGEILICDNIQNVPANSTCGFFASPDKRYHNWAAHNWESLSKEYNENGYPVAIVQWRNDPIATTISGPAEGPGWIRDLFSFHGYNTYLSYPVFNSPLTSGRLIDMRNGVWENGHYTGRKVKAIFMPTLNNHGEGSEDYAGITSAVKCFFGATEIHSDENATVYFEGKTCHHIHSSSYSDNNAYHAGELAARFIKTMYSPVLYITCAIWSGHESRTGNATETKTVLACENPATLDYVSGKYVISPFASWLHPDKNTNTRNQILGCIDGGIGTITQGKYKIVSYDFSA